MIELTPQERDKFALYLDQAAQQEAQIIEQLKTLGPAHNVMVKRKNAEVMACQIVAQLLRSRESMTIGSDNLGEYKE